MYVFYIHIYIYIWEYKQAYLFGRDQPVTVLRKSPRPPNKIAFSFCSGAWGTSSAQPEPDCGPTGMSISDVFSSNSQIKNPTKNNFVCRAEF